MGKKKISRVLITNGVFTTGCTCWKAIYLYVLEKNKADKSKNELTLLNEKEFKNAASCFLNSTYSIKYLQDTEKISKKTKEAITAL